VAAILGHIFPCGWDFAEARRGSALGVFLVLNWPCNAMHSGGVCGDLCADTVCFAGVDCGLGYVSAVWAYFVAQRSAMVWFGFLFIPLLIL